MSAKWIETAKQKKTDAENRLRQVQEEVSTLEREIKGWQDFIDRAESLAAESSAHIPKSSEGIRPHTANGVQAKVRVRKGSLAGVIAEMLLHSDPLPLRVITERLQKDGMGAGVKEYSAAVNSAIWRRKNDIFLKTGAGFVLRTKEIEFVE